MTFKRLSLHRCDSLKSCLPTELNSVALVRKRTIPIERPPLVGEVSANFCGERMSRGQRNGSPRPYYRVLCLLTFTFT
jgi:hypothetical protein